MSTAPLLLLLAGLAHAACPDHAAVTQLDVERFTGMWNFIKESDNLLAGTSRNVKCKHSILSILSPEFGHDVRLTVATYNLTSRTYDETRLGLRKMKNNPHDGKFEIFVSEFHKLAGRCFVAGTDYDNYAVVWLCYEGLDDGEYIEYNAILSRKKSLSERYLSEAKKLLPHGPYRIVDQKSCSEYKSSQP